MEPSRFLIITSHRSTDNTWAEREKYVQAFIEQLEDRLEDTKVLYTTYDDISCLIKGSQVQMVDMKHGVDLKDVDVVHFKNWMFDSEQAATIAFYLQSHGVAFFNSEVNAGLAWGKIAQMCRLALGDVPVPDSYFAKRAVLAKLFEEDRLPDGFSFPLIMKADAGSKGNDNYLIKTAREALAVLAAAESDKEFVIQKFLPNDGDYRYLFIGLDSDPIVFHRKGTAGSHLNNTSQGGQGTIIPDADIPNEHLKLARKAAEILKREISGVDVLVDKATGLPYVLEVNSTPAIATGYAIERKNAKFARFLQEIFEQKEEE